MSNAVLSTKHKIDLDIQVIRKGITTIAHPERAAGSPPVWARGPPGRALARSQESVYNVVGQ